MKPCRVGLLTYDNGSGGAATAVSRLARGLTSSTIDSNEFSFQLLLASLHDKDFFVPKKQLKSNIFQGYYSNEVILDKCLSRAWSIAHRTRFSPKVFFRQGYRDLRSEAQDYRIFNMFWMQGLADLSKLGNLSSPLVLTLHDMWFLTGGCSYSFECNGYENGCSDCRFIPSILRRNIANQYKFKSSMLFGRNVKIVVTSEWMRNAAVMRGIDIERIELIKNYIPETYHCFDDKSLARDLLGIDNRLKFKKILYFVGSISDPRKGFDLFFEAVKLLPYSLRAELLILHLGQVDNTYDLFFRDLKVEIVHLGLFVDEVPQIVAYNAADFLICPSRYDNTPNVIAEAHMCGLPVITANSSGCVEMVDDGKNGRLVDVEDSEKFASTIEASLKSLEFLSNIGIGEGSKDIYGKDATCGKYLKLYRSMI